MRAALLVLRFELFRSGSMATAFFAAVPLLFALLMLVPELGLVRAVKERFETRARIEVAEPALRERMTEAIDDWVPDGVDVVEVVAPAPSPPPAGTVRVQVPSDVFEGAGFTVTSETASGRAVHAGVAALLHHLWVERILGPAPAVRTSWTAAELDAALAGTSERAATWGLALLALGSAVFSGGTLGGRLARRARGGDIELLALTAPRRSILAGVLGSWVVADLTTRAVLGAVVAVLWTWLSPVGVPTGLLAALPVVLWVAFVVGATALACTLRVDRAMDGVPAALEPLVLLGLHTAVAVGALVVWLFPALAWLPGPGALGAVGAWAAGDPWAVPLLLWHTLLAIVAVEVALRV